MTKQFCDICGKEIYGDNKFQVYMTTQAKEPTEWDVCYDCQKEFKNARKQADVDTFKAIKERKKEGGHNAVL